MKIRAIIFDLDGVLVDATEWHYNALNRALALFGYTITRYEHLTDYNGLPTRKKLEMLSVTKGLPRGLHRLLNGIKQKYTRQEILQNCVPAFEKEYMISRFRREGYRLAVCSNSIRDSIQLMLEGSGILDGFEFFVSNEEVVKPKPDPQMYRIALERLGIKPSEAVVVEDAEPGVRAAQDAGTHVCRVVGYEDVTYSRINDFIRKVESHG